MKYFARKFTSISLGSIFLISGLGMLKFVWLLLQESMGSKTFLIMHFGLSCMASVFMLILIFSFAFTTPKENDEEKNKWKLKN